MGTKFQKYPVFKYDEPAIIESFSGGINTDPANENLAVNELKNALNMHYSQASLRTRWGASKIATIQSSVPIENVQGIFFFGASTPTIIIAANGKLYSGLYGPDIQLEQIHILSARVGLEYPDPLDEFTGLPEFSEEIEGLEHDGFVLTGEGGYRGLIFQNKRKIEAASYEDALYIATGTRLVKLVEEAGELVATMVQPYEANGIEVLEIGPNLLSPFPNYCLKKFKMDGVMTQIHGVTVTQIDDDKYLAEAVMTFQDGKLPEDYYFKWEFISQSGNATPIKYADSEHNLMIFKTPEGFTSLSKGRVSVEISKAEAENFRLRCTFAGAFMKDENGAYETEEITTIEGTYTDYIINTATDQWYGQATSFAPLHFTSAPSDTWAKIQSCVKILSDGNKFILYDDINASGAWWKTIIDNPAYVVQRGSLNFKTDKNERLLKVIQYKGVMVAFANNEISGGNISVISGNGDDYKTDDYNYSPYARKVVCVNASTDNADSVQTVGNMIIFKYKTSVYIIEGSELNNEVISITCVNDKVKMRSPDVYIPWENNNCISEITDEYYALIWPEELGLVNGEIEVIRPATRAKMYHKIPTTDESRLFLSFPWLWDQGKNFNITSVVYISGIATHLYENILLQYNPQISTDLGETHTCVVRLKPNDLNYPKIVKFVNSMTLYYHRGDKDVCGIKVQIYNEAGFLLYEKDERDLGDYRVLYAGDNDGSQVRLDSAIVNVKVFNFPYAFPALLLDTVITITTKEDFSFSSITFQYTTAETADVTPFGAYSKIVRKGGKLTIRPSLPLAVNTTTTDEVIVGGGGAGDFGGDT